MRHFIGTVCLCLFISTPLYAGELGDYEGGVDNPPSPGEKQQGSSPSSGSRGGVVISGDDDGCCNLFDFITRMFVYGTQSSMLRMFNGSRDEGLMPRQMGEVMLPVLRYDNYYSRLNSNQHSVDQRLELGWGAIAFEYRLTDLTQYSPAYQLQWEQHNFLWRLSFGNNLGINYGFGDGILRGSSINYGSNGVFQVFIHGRRFGLEYRSTGTTYQSGAFQSDEDITFMMHSGMASLNLGYRRIAIPGNELSGYYLGYSLHM